MEGRGQSRAGRSPTAPCEAAAAATATAGEWLSATADKLGVMRPRAGAQMCGAQLTEEARAVTAGAAAHTRTAARVSRWPDG